LVRRAFIVLIVEKGGKMQQAFYYTLGAIAQSFSAIIVLNGIFITFKLDSLTHRRNELFLQLKTLLYKDQGGSSGFQVDRNLARERTEAYSEKELLAWGEDGRGQNSIVAEKSSVVDEIIKTNIKYNYVIKSLKTPLKINGLVIAMSVLFLVLQSLRIIFFTSLVLIEVGLLSLIALYITIHSILAVTNIRQLLLADH
jgi:hypothetical protein